MSRPHHATLTVQCFVAGCSCSREVAVRFTETADKSQLIERDYEKNCPICGHRTIAHATVKIEKGDAIERRKQART